MKNLYEILNRKGIHICYQVAENEKDAIDFAKMYGHKGVAQAVFVQKN